MARMLGASTAYRICWCDDCRPSQSEQRPRKKAQRAREKRLWKRSW